MKQKTKKKEIPINNKKKLIPIKKEEAQLISKALEL